MKKILTKAFILPLIVILAVALVFFKVKSKTPLEHEVKGYPAKAVEVITVKKLPFRSRAIAYGSVEPAVVLKAKTEVSGKISYIHPALQKGASLAKGTVVLRIEPTTFEFSLDQSKAGLSSSLSSLKQLEVEEKSTRRSLSLATQNLTFGEKESDRLRSILKKGLISRSAFDAQEQKVLQLRQTVEDLAGKLDTYTSRTSVIQAQINQSKTQLAQSKDTLGRTEVVLPFDARIGEVLVEKGEYTTIGSLLFEALGTQAVEISAQLPIKQFSPLLMGLGDRALNLQTPSSLMSAVSSINLEANVSLVGRQDDAARWKGELLYIGESIDPTRDTMSLVVSVNDPYGSVIPGHKPPLLKGMYVAVEFFAPPHQMFVLPRRAVHQGRVYIAKDDNTLEIRPVNILYQQGVLVVVGDENAISGLKEGEKVIVTDVIPVINGMPLKPTHAKAVELQLAKDALGHNIVGNDLNNTISSDGDAE